MNSYVQADSTQGLMLPTANQAVPDDPEAEHT